LPICITDSILDIDGSVRKVHVPHIRRISKDGDILNFNIVKYVGEKCEHEKFGDLVFLGTFDLSDEI